MGRSSPTWAAIKLAAFLFEDPHSYFSLRVTLRSPSGRRQ